MSVIKSSSACEHYLTEVLGVHSVVWPDSQPMSESVVFPEPVSEAVEVDLEVKRVPLLLVTDFLEEKETLLAQRIIAAMKWPESTRVHCVSQLQPEALEKMQALQVVVLSENLAQYMSVEIGEKRVFGETQVLFTYGLSQVTRSTDALLTDSLKRKMWEHFKTISLTH